MDKKKVWFNKECQEAVDKRQTAKQIVIQNPTRINIDNYTRTRTVTNNIIKRQKRLSEKNALEEIEIYSKNPRMFFEKYASIKDGFKTRASMKKDDDNNLLSDSEKIVNNFRNYFERLLNNNNDNQFNNYLPYEQVIKDTVEPELPKPNLKEIEQIVNALKNNKSPSENNINLEL